MTTKSLLHSSLLDNQYYTSMLVGNAGYEPPSEVILAEEVLTSTQASISFTSGGAWGNYEHLQIRAVARSNRPAQVSSIFDLQLNSDTTASYAWHLMSGNGSAVRTDAGSSQNQARMGRSPAATSVSDGFSGLIIDILDINNANKNTTLRSLQGWTTQAEEFDQVGLFSGLWMNTSQVTAINIIDRFGSFVAGSRFTLIGLK